MLILFFNFNVPSSVHGHWLLARAAALFPGTDLARNVSILFDQQFTAEKVKMAVLEKIGKDLIGKSSKKQRIFYGQPDRKISVFFGRLPFAEY